MLRVVAKEGALDGWGGGELQQRNGWLYMDSDVISSAWKCS